MQTPSRPLRNIVLEKCVTPLNIPASPFMKSLGYGTGVNVYRLERSPKQGKIFSPLAVKRISKNAQKSESGELFNERIQKEAEILRKLTHPNIVGFRGIHKSPEGVETLILECCKTSLGTILEDRKEEDLGPLPPKDTLKMIVDISQALDYLHNEARLLHGDIKSYNILVKGDFEICKLCDFGVCLPLGGNGLINFTENPNLRYVGTSLWSAPEIIEDQDVVDSKADIFSFGLVIYETVALVPPHFLSFNDDCVDNDESNDENKDKSNNDYSLNSTADISEITESIEKAYGTRPLLPQAFELSDSYNRILEIFYCCTNYLAEDRPTAKIIWESLKKEEEQKEPNAKTDTEKNE